MSGKLSISLNSSSFFITFKVSKFEHWLRLKQNLFVECQLKEKKTCSKY